MALTLHSCVLLVLHQVHQFALQYAEMGKFLLQKNVMTEQTMDWAVSLIAQIIILILTVFLVQRHQLLIVHLYVETQGFSLQKLVMTDQV